MSHATILFIYLFIIFLGGGGGLVGGWVSFKS